jgi:hypothetical protein
MDKNFMTRYASVTAITLLKALPRIDLARALSLLDHSSNAASLLAIPFEAKLDGSS